MILVVVFLLEFRGKALTTRSDRLSINVNVDPIVRGLRRVPGAGKSSNDCRFRSGQRSILSMQETFS